MEFGIKRNKRSGPCGPGLVLSKSQRGRLCVKPKTKGPSLKELRAQSKSLGLKVTKKKNGKTVLANKADLKRRITRTLNSSGLASSFGKYKKGQRNKRAAVCGPGLKRSKYQKGRLCVKDLPKVSLRDLQRQALSMRLSIYKKKKDGSPSSTLANKRTLKLRISRAM